MPLFLYLGWYLCVLENHSSADEDIDNCFKCFVIWGFYGYGYDRIQTMHVNYFGWINNYICFNV